MSFKFIQWYRAKRNLLVLLYLVSSLMFCSTLGATIIPQNLITIQSSGFYVNSHSNEVKPFQANPERLQYVCNYFHSKLASSTISAHYMGSNCHNAKSLFKDIWTSKVLDCYLYTANEPSCGKKIVRILTLSTS
jgi:hypothetical protein